MRLKGPCGLCGNGASFNYSRSKKEGKCFSCGIEKQGIEGILKFWNGPSIFALGVNGPKLREAKEKSRFKRHSFL